jgi:hypothetical protein
VSPSTPPATTPPESTPTPTVSGVDPTYDRRGTSRARQADDERGAPGEVDDREARWQTLAEAMPQLVWTCRADGYSDFSTSAGSTTPDSGRTRRGGSGGWT